VLTRPGWAVVAGIIAGTATGRLFGVTELYVLVAVATALVVLAIAWVRRPVPPVTLERQVSPGRLGAGDLGRVQVTVRNRGRRRLPSVTLVDPVEGTVGARLAIGPTGPGDRQDAGYRLPVLRRGQLHVGPLVVELVDPFGIARRWVGTLPEQAITVLPAIDPLPDLPLGGGRHEPLAGLSRRAASASGAADLITLRPYVVGDDLRRVHWPSTARADELQVRRDEDRWQGHVAVLLDTRADALDPADFERAVSAAAGIVDAVAASGDRVRVATTSGRDSGMVDAARGEHELLEDLALVLQDRQGALELPAADRRRPVALLVLTGEPDPALVAAVDAAGFTDRRLISFSGHPSCPGADVVVGPGEPVAVAWGRAVDEAER
jgi:uncharacterized protein (DUF58 family)